MQSDGSRLKIQITVSSLTYEKHKFLLGISDWSDIAFRYDCQNEEFVVYSVRLGSI